MKETLKELDRLELEALSIKKDFERLSKSMNELYEQAKELQELLNKKVGK